MTTEKQIDDGGPAQDATKHHLYRPHMGDMTGWRFLEKDEEIKLGDEYISLVHIRTIWGSVMGFEVGSQVFECSPAVYAYRRRVSPAESKPSDQKRLITVVLDMNQSNYEELFENAVSYREGNYLDKFDNAKERVLKALEGEV